MSLLPWEPTIRATRETFEFDYAPDPGDKCDHCGCELEKQELMVSNNAGWNFCSWHCLIWHADQYPDHFYVEDLGAYDSYLDKEKYPPSTMIDPKIKFLRILK
jgi:hypothetical protein